MIYNFWYVNRGFRRHGIQSAFKPASLKDLSRTDILIQISRHGDPATLAFWIWSDLKLEGENIPYL